MSQQGDFKNDVTTQNDEELNIIKDYLDELYYATQNLYNKNYYDTLLNYKKLGTSKQSNVLKCLTTKETGKDKIKKSHFDHKEKLNNSNYSYYSDQDHNSSQSHHSYNSNNTSNYENSFLCQFKTKKHRQKDIQNKTNETKNILFSFNTADEFSKKKKIHKDQKKEILYFNTKEKNIFHKHKNGKQKNKSLITNNNTKELSNHKIHNFKTKLKEKQYNNIHNYKNQKETIKIIPQNYNNILYSQNIENVKNDLNKSYTFENIIQMNNYKIKDLKDKEDNIKFTNDKEKELFQYLILKAINEIDQISCKLDQKYKNQLINKVNSLQEKYEHKIKDLYKIKLSLDIQNEELLKKDKDNKELIKKLESTKHIMLDQIENFKKYNHIIYNKFSQKDMYQNETNDTIENLKLEQKINTLNEDLNNNYQKYDYYYKKSDTNQQLLQQKEDQIEKLKNQLNIHFNSKKEIQEKLNNIYTENNRVERDNDYLKNELTKTKLNLEKLKDEYEELYNNKEYVISCYKNEEKIVKENLERYKTKCVILENQKDCHILEDKYKQLEIKLKDTENEKYMYERTCLMNEKKQNDMATEIKDLKNELFDCKNRLYKMRKSDVSDVKTTLYSQDILRDKIKDNEKDKETFQFNYNIQSDQKMEHEEISDDFLNFKQKISSIEKQLILLKLEKANKESELIRCPKNGRRNEEIKKKEFIETKLKYLEDKINILNKNLKYIKLKNNEKNNI
ncbi:conserved Plasmodium protein, unknown function [Plasmodium sp. gorilla clade G2]|uniref:conserved Plasmodium protein, unknown function n=1 Tax=Plasmodium sp. gorilla clade G2 TaxID=880535 RepID=UPI000D21D984|nr:conserved Plasmodium protein, unknown function [Plasmodium sp. gorilla clade G2]SOV11050.1 conserved Plasmodium protein, unknown function [Plasmodium sp. gorilla clade G2]